MGLFSKAAATHFPLVKGRRFDGTDVRFPQDLPADATLLVLLFDDGLDPLADQWARLGDRLVERHGDRFAVLELPASGKKMKLLGDLGTIGIRHQLDDDDERARTIPIYVNVKAFRKELKLKKGDVTALLVARDGRIAWRGDGDIEMDEIEGLEAAVEEVLAAPTPSPEDHPDLGRNDEDEADEARDDGPQTANDAEAGGEPQDGAPAEDEPSPPTGDARADAASGAAEADGATTEREGVERTRGGVPDDPPEVGDRR